MFKRPDKLHFKQVESNKYFNLDSQFSKQVFLTYYTNEDGANKWSDILWFHVIASF
jgi:hypothetical protein